MQRNQEHIFLQVRLRILNYDIEYIDCWSDLFGYSGESSMIGLELRLECKGHISQCSVYNLDK